jgi:hypothetical protein
VQPVNLESLFLSLDRTLRQYRALWQFQAFHQFSTPWPQHPEFWQALQSLPPAALTQSTNHRANFLAPWVADSMAIARRCQVPYLAGPLLHLPKKLNYAVPGRKWQQIVPFAALTPAHQHIVEWCAGQGHLGRVLAAGDAASVTSLEWSEPLCRRGGELAARAGLAIDFAMLDVTTDSASAYLHPHSHAVALHACGDLHTRLIELAVERNIAGITLSPCCYHLTQQASYQPMSPEAAHGGLTLSKADLRLAVKACVTAGAAARRRAQQEVSWRLGFDSWQKEQRGIDEYLPLPNLPSTLLRGSFHEFAQWAAKIKGLRTPTLTMSKRHELLGQAGYQAVRRMEWVQQFFARPLELWLLLDRALFLQAHGYSVSIGEFCDYQVTPRNLVICAHTNDPGNRSSNLAIA